ncbi:MAG: cytochrome c biogenesis protein CcsA [Chlorobi bacterium]|nr:cytochrome c biogenesis protein CcsA [Chlorobiota bacterium]
MKKIIQILISPAFAVILLSVTAIGLALATFIENSYDTAAARAAVYNARWFETALFLTAISLAGNIIVFKLYKPEKTGSFLIHLGFIIMIAGAAITRYTGFEGTMHIREGSASSVVYSQEPFFMLESPEDNYKFEIKINYETFKNNRFKFNFISKRNGKTEIVLKEIIPDAKEEIKENMPDGTDMINIRYTTGDFIETTLIHSGEIKNTDNSKIAFNNFSDSSAVIIYGSKNNLKIKYGKNLFITDEHGHITDTLKYDAETLIHPGEIIKSGNLLFMITDVYKNAETVLISKPSETNSFDALIAEIKTNGKKHIARIFGGNGYFANPENYNIDGLQLRLAFGSKPVKIPFSLYLNDFILERYPGSMSPSSYESLITLIDNEKNISKKYKIYMNHILDYRGYRFFQSSYDRDEKGTVLSVSRDKAGTTVTYISYILLTVGFIIILFSKKSRFYNLRKEISKSGNNGKKSLFTVLLLILTATSSYAQTHINPEHADKFGHLIVQTFDGRFEPVNTLAYDVLRKLSKKKSVKTENGKDLNAMQIFLGIITDPEYWSNQKIIFVKDKTLRNIISINDKYASYNDFFDSKQQYKIADYSERAYRTELPAQTTFDKELIKTEERLNIFMMIAKGNLLKIFPDRNSANHNWVSPRDSVSFAPLTGNLKILNDDLNLPVLNYNNIFNLYVKSLKDAETSGDYTFPDRIAGYISDIQRQSAENNILPSKQKVKIEIFYNKADIFSTLTYIYMILSLILIITAFFAHFSEKQNSLSKHLLNIFIIILAMAFLYHTAGLILRWYISGHAPWSNGYETLIFVAWGGLLAGFIFMKHSKITLAATSLLAFFIMLTAGFSNYDPQITNLQPVLKSYWLIIHVAVIVISYGFLGLGFILGLLNLILYASKNEKNYHRLNKTIKELSAINEMNLIIGLFLATTGTFLGAVWANESWGKYWGWDAKETWALIIIIIYTIVLHLRLIPRFKNRLIFNIASVLAFGSVVMTFVGVNFYFSKGLHSYAQGNSLIFPVWAQIIILSIILLCMAAALNQSKINKYIKISSTNNIKTRS